MKLLQNRGDVVGFLHAQCQSGSSVLNSLKRFKRGSWQACQERVTVVNSRENERCTKFGSSYWRQVFSDRRNLADMEVTRFDSLSNEGLNGECVIESSTKVLDRGG